MSNTVVHYLSHNADIIHNNQPSYQVQQVIDGELDVAAAWGPMAGYYKAMLHAPLIVQPVNLMEDKVPMEFDMALAVPRRRTDIKAAIETAQLQLDWCSIQSPINGRIGLRLVDPGNIITANTTNLVVINQLEPIAVNFTLPEDQLPAVLKKLQTEKRMAVEAYDQADTAKLATGYLLTADNQIDTTTGTGKLKAVFDNKDQALFPNQFVNIHLVMEDRPNALVVPSAAIQTGNQGAFVWVVDTDAAKKTSTARMQTVKIALAEGQLTILDSGLEPGQQVVVDGADRLRAGQPVTINVPHQHSGGQSAGHGAAASQGKQQ